MGADRDLRVVFSKMQGHGLRIDEGDSHDQFSGQAAATSYLVPLILGLSWPAVSGSHWQVN